MSGPEHTTRVEVNPQIFREYDIRGIVDQDLTGPVLETIGRAYAAAIPQALRLLLQP
jgi:phosphomannomutase/phosphoglucomutase